MYEIDQGDKCINLSMTCAKDLKLQKWTQTIPRMKEHKPERTTNLNYIKRYIIY
jgi:hypothetical protein